jgi:LysM repeat protein
LLSWYRKQPITIRAALVGALVGGIFVIAGAIIEWALPDKPMAITVDIQPTIDLQSTIEESISARETKRADEQMTLSLTSTFIRSDDPSTPQPVWLAYQVQAGDTFESISSSFNVPANILIEDNGFTSNQPLSEGEVLRIPIYEKGNIILGILRDSIVKRDISVLVMNNGDESTILNDWTLTDNNGNRFILPNAEIKPNSAIIVHTTKKTADNPDFYYWELSNTFWTTGDYIAVRDNNGIIKDIYYID